ncbi:MAG TPA: glycosyltransferase [Elusimicrobiota bacterium]|nr:glycosyltransferase [Elusimicrobiota bacterium]
MEDNKKVIFSVVMPVYNAERYLQDSLQSVLDQTRPADEIIVVDNGSTDRSTGILRGYGDRIRFIRIEKNAGVSAARNLGIKESRGTHVAFIDADDRWFPDKLAVYEQKIMEHPSAALFFSDAFSISEEGDTRSLICCRPPDGRLFETLLVRNRVVTSSAVIRRSIVPEVGMFREDFLCRAGVEDWEFYIRITHVFPALHIGQFLTEYRVYPTSAIQNNKRDLLEQDALRVIDLHTSSPDSSLPVRAAAIASVYHASGVRHMAYVDLEGARQRFVKCFADPALFRSSLLMWLSTWGGPLFVKSLLKVRARIQQKKALAVVQRGRENSISEDRFFVADNR